MVLLTVSPFVPVLCFVLEQAGVRRAKRQWERAQPPEFATRKERRAFYRQELSGQRRAPRGTPWVAYAALSREQQALFDLMYSQVLSGGVAAGRQDVRPFDLPYPLKKDEYNQVVELYEASIEPGQYPDHRYWTDDGRIVRRASCNRIIHTR